MKTNFNYLGLGAIALTAALAAAPVQAQTVATADFDGAVVKTKAFTAAAATIKTTYQAQITQVEGYQKELQTLLAPFDTNKDNRIDDDELRAAQSNPSWQSVVAKQQQINTAQAPFVRAQAYAFEQVSAKLDQAVKNVIAARNISLIVKPDAVMFANPTTGNITGAVTAELDKLVPAVGAIPPATWQPGGQPTAPATATPTTPAPAPATGAKKPGR